MSRHRIVRRMNYEDECYDDEDDYGHSYEDSYCVSPGTAAQFTFNRDKDLSLSSYMEDEIPEQIPEETEEDLEPEEEQKATPATGLSDVDRARFQSCLEEVHNIMGDTVPETVVTEAILRHNFNPEATLNELLSLKEAPKAQRTPRNRRDRTQGATNSTPAASQQQKQQQQHQPSPQPELPINPAAPRPAVITTSSVKSVARKGFDVNTTNNVGQQVSVETAADRLSREVAACTVDAGADKSKTPTRSSFSGKGVDSPNSSRPQTPQRLDHAPMGVPRSASKSKNDKIDAKAEYVKRQGDKELINLVVIGHVDAGKSTLMGHVLYQLGSVQQRTMHKYEQEARKLGKASFAYAWVLDETEEERSRGVTMDVAQTRFMTDKKMVTLLDAPGHKDFIPNMITGAAQADVAILVINATKGEFETGFDSGGQTREHALLAKSLGVSQIIIAINKMDTVEWDQSRYDDIVKKLKQFLKQVGFKEADLSFVPCSGLAGQNLTSAPTEEKLTTWYTGPTLLQRIDQFKNLERPVDKPFRLSVSDVFKGASGGFSIAGRISAGYIRPGDKVMVMPAANMAGIKNVTVDDLPSQIAFAGDHVTLTLTGIDMASVNIGFVLCDPSSPSHCATRIRAKMVLFNLEVPITKGFPVVFHYQCINEPAVIKRLVATLNKSTGEVTKNRPKCLTKNTSAIVEIEFERTVCLELYTEFRDLGRFMLRTGGHTIAAGLIEEIVQTKMQRDEQN